MPDYTGSNVYTRIGARPTINAAGNITLWGGSTPSPVVQEAMDEASMCFVEMKELFEKSGEHIADLLDVEAAYVTSGCYAALVLSTAACITGNDPEKRAQLPDTEGLPSQVLIQKKQRYGYDRSYTVPGSSLIEVGDDNGTTPEQLEEAIGPETAAVAFLIGPNPDPDLVPIEQVVEIAHKHDVSVIGDAAAQIYPLDFLRNNAQSADLVCFGGKYMHAPHSTGFLCGKKELVDAAHEHGLAGPRPLGRGMKIDRQEIIGLVAALDHWVSMDHETRLDGYRKIYATVQKALEGISAVQEAKIVTTGGYWVLDLHIVFDPDALGKDAKQIAEDLQNGTPRIRINTQRQNTLVIRANNLSEGDEQTVAEKIRSALSN